MSESHKRQRYAGRMLVRYRRCARLRSIEWRLTREEFEQIVARDCHYCGEPPRTRFFSALNYLEGRYERMESVERLNGIDRVDNAKGYTLKNSVACCKHCNRLKGDMRLGDFLDLLKRILKHTRAT